MSETANSSGDLAAAPIIAAYREKVLYTMAVIAATVIAPFSVLNLYRGYLLVGLLSLTVVLVFVADALAIYRGRKLPVPVPVAFAGVIFALAVAIEQRGLLGIFWTFPAILLFHFVLERRLANLFNLSLVVLVALFAFRTLESDVALRIVAGQLLTIAFTNIFSYVVEAEQVKETEQRRRLGLLVRATQAGFYQWERGQPAVTYSGRLKEMLGYAADADTSGWPPFTELVHPEDRGPRLKLFQAGARDRSVRNGVRRHVAGDFRMFQANGSTIWVHSEGLFIHDAEGVAQRYIASLIDVTERYRQEEALRRSIQVREEVERIARHDLRTPLNGILSVPRLLREGRKLDAREEELLGMVEGAAYRILDMVNLSVDLYRMEQGDYRFSPRAVDLAGLAETVAREVRAHAATKGVTITASVNGEAAPAGRPVHAWGGELLCYSIIANLLKNAVEASPDGSVVNVAFDTDAAQVRLRIHNQGVVPLNVREYFFEKYATSGKVGGFGLGTYSARLMARVQDGELGMETSEAAGTTLTLALPAVPAAVASPSGRQETGESRGAAPEQPLPALRVLVADDDEFNIVFMRSVLPNPPLEVASAINGRAAADAAQAQPPDVVFMDIEMPVMNGFEALARIRAMELQAGRRQCTVVAFSSYDDDATRQQCREAGFDAYLSKPATRERIHEILRAVGAGAPLPEQVAGAAQGRTPGPQDPVEIDADLRGAMPRFIATRNALLDEYRAALAAGERVAAGRIAHKLAGSFALYRFTWAAAECRALKIDSGSGDPVQLGRRCDALQRHLEQVRLRAAG